jgi:hypothetical protein
MICSFTTEGEPWTGLKGKFEESVEGLIIGFMVEMQWRT